MTKKKTALSPIQAILNENSTLLTDLCNGLGAIKRSDLKHIEVSLRKEFADSIDIDSSFREGHEGENRWDYLLGVTETSKVVGLEPHSAKDGETSVVIAKRIAALQQLRGHMKESARVSAWLWVASGDVYFANTEKTRFKLDQKIV